MMYSLASFSISDMTECASDLRKLGVGALSMQDVAQRIASYLYRQLGDDQTGRQDCVLVRCFLTRAYGELDPQSQDCARRALGCGPGSLAMKCLTLFGTAGEKPEWNERDRSRRYRSIPLAGNQVVSHFPMISQLLQQLGVALESKSQPDSDLLVDWAEQTLNVFHVLEAKGSPFVPAQEEFVIPFGIESIVGFGGILPSKELFTVILFSKQKVSRETAELLKPLGLSVKLALLPFDESGAKRSIIRVESWPGRLQARAETLEQLLAVHEQTSAHSPLQGAQAEVRLRRLHETTSASLSFADKLAELLKMGCEELGLELGVLAKAEGNTLIVEALHAPKLPITAGMSFTIEETYCRQTLRSTEPVGVEHAGASHEWRAHPFYKVFSLEAYLGAQVLVEGEVYGTLSFSSRPPHPLPFTATDKEFLKLMAQWVGGELERKRREQEQDRLIEDLTKSQQHFQALFNWTPSAVGISTVAEGRFIDVNEGFSRLTGYKREEAIGRTTLELGLWAEPSERAIVLREIHEQGSLHNREGLLRTKSGEIRALMVSVEPIQLGPTPCLIYLGHDITERKRVEEALRDSYERLQRALEASHAGTWRVDLITGLDGRDAALNRLLGLPATPTVQPTEDWFTYIHPDDLPSMRDAWERSMVTGLYDVVHRLVRRDGQTLWVHDRGLVCLDATGRPLYAIGAVHDITERKRAEEALRLAKFSVDRAADAVYWIDQQAKVLDVNEAASLMLGYSKDELCAMTVHDLNPDFQADMWLGFWEETRRRGTMVFETAHRAKNGRSIPVEVSVNYLSYEGKDYHCAFVRDITDRKGAEEIFKNQEQRLRSTLEQVRTLSGRIGTAQEEERTRLARELHDELGVGLTCLKIDLSRLATIVGDDIGADARAKLDDKVRSMVEQVDGTIASVQRLVPQLRPPLLNDLGLVAAIEWQCQDFQKRTGIPCTCVTSADNIAVEPEWATALFRICQEALTNTMRHAQATAVTIKLESRNGSLQLMVADNGLGITDMKVSDRQSLGLIGMRERVALFGGEVTIQGHPEKGTTITVCLPRALS
jgi:PAS domain S-box-containing protein